MRKYYKMPNQQGTVISEQMRNRDTEEIDKTERETKTYWELHRQPELEYNRDMGKTNTALAVVKVPNTQTDTQAGRQRQEDNPQEYWQQQIW